MTSFGGDGPKLLTVKQVSELTGISIRALHHYHSIGLLMPASVSESGYRRYDEASLKRLRTILLFRELELPLADIKRTIDSPNFDERTALIIQKDHLSRRIKRLEKLIELADSIIKGEETMDFKAFNNDEAEALRTEAKRRWGETPAYAEFEQRDKMRGDAERNAAAEELMRIFAELGRLRSFGEPADGPAAQDAALRLKAHITANYYTCTDEILLGLAQTYCSDPRFKANIDGAGGEGTAEYAAEAIRALCAKA